jgi:tetratricopeptide (TPR) repeat protein
MHSGANALVSNQDPEERWRMLIEQGRRMIDDRDLTGARLTLREALAYADETWGEEDVHLIRPLRLMAESYWREHGPLDRKNQNEVECLQRALAIARRKLPPDHLEIGRLTGEVGTHLQIAGHLNEACALMLECLQIADKNTSEDFTRYATGIAHVRMEQGLPAEALPFFERAALAYERRRPSSTIHAIARFHLGKCLVALHRNQEAVNHLELALRLVDGDRVDGKRRHAPLMSEIMDLIDRARTETP